MRIQLGHTIRAARIKRCAFRLWNSLDFSKHLGRAGLIKANLGIDQSNGFQQVQSADARNLCCCVRLLKRQAHETLSFQVVDLIRLHLLNQCNFSSQISKVILDQMEMVVDLCTKSFNTLKINITCTTLYTHILFNHFQETIAIDMRRFVL